MDLPTETIINVSIAVAIVGAIWGFYTFGLLQKCFDAYLMVVFLPFVVPFALLVMVNLLFQEKKGMDMKIMAGYPYKTMNWREFIKFKFTGKGRQLATWSDFEKDE